MRIRLLFLLLLTAGIFAGCSSLTQRTLSHAWAQWHQGSRDRAIDLTKEELGRYIQANDLTEEKVSGTARVASKKLDETLIFDGLAKKPPNPHELLNQGPSALSKELRQDLGSDDSVRVMRALQTVQSLELREHALSVMAIVYRRKPYTDTSKFFDDAPAALRSVSVKWTAFETLRGFVSNGSRSRVLKP